MTTIVYDHEIKQIAIDSRINRDGMIISDNREKFKYSGAILFFYCGASCDLDLLISAHHGDKIDGEINCNAIYINNGLIYRCGVEDGSFWSEEIKNNDSMGSGCFWALAALDFGKSAKEAVEYAMTRDCYTGGKVHVYDIESARFLD